MGLLQCGYYDQDNVGIIMIMHNNVIRMTMISGGIIRIIDHMTIYSVLVPTPTLYKGCTCCLPYRVITVLFMDIAQKGILPSSAPASNQA